MSIFIFFLILAIILIIVTRILVQKGKFLKFLTTGLDSGFKFKEILLLFQVAETAQLEEPVSLFWSVQALNQSIACIVQDAKKNHTEDTPKVQDFLSRLYQYRTKVELEEKSNKTLKTTKGLLSGQKLRIVLPGHGVFSSSVVNIGRELVISLPTQKGQFLITGSDWIGKAISVYLQRPGDAGYVFDSVVVNAGQFNSLSSIYVTHSDKLVRTQKRKSVRCQCNIIGQLYIKNSETMSELDVEAIAGLKCLIEDISEDGALIRIGGKGKNNIPVKLQFPIYDQTIVMFGTVRAVEYNAKLNQSRLHFECLNLDPTLRNSILSYVYNVLPQNERDEYDAITQAENDSNEIQASIDSINPVEEPVSNHGAEQINTESNEKVSVEQVYSILPNSEEL